MFDDPLSILLLIVGLFVFFLALFAFLTYLFLKMAVDLKAQELKTEK